MRVAAISDIHGNLPALEAVLADIEREDVDAIVVAGDSVSGPWPAEVFDRLQASARGSFAETRTGSRRSRRFDRRADGAGTRIASVPNASLPSLRWPLTLELEVDGLGHVLVCHSTPGLGRADLHPLTPDDEVLDVTRPAWKPTCSSAATPTCSTTGRSRAGFAS